jgi:hypothetical protein
LIFVSSYRTEINTYWRFAGLPQLAQESVFTDTSDSLDIDWKQMNSRVLQMLFVKIWRKRFRIEEDEFYSFVLRKSPALDLGLVCFLLLDSPLGLRTVSFKLLLLPSYSLWGAAYEMTPWFVLRIPPKTPYQL